MSLRALFCLLSASAVLANTAGFTACSRITSKLGGQLVQTSNSSDFETIIGTPLDLVNNKLRPACVVIPQNTEHVSVAMKAIYQAQCPYAVLAAGHSGMKGWNAVQDGVLIYFRDMNQTTYDSKQNSITLQPGIRWVDAVTELAPFGVTPVSGRAASVGMGFLLGGGISFLSPQMGFAADTFKELDVVLVNGTVVTANANNRYSDLFKSLKGGGNRFGIVTRYEVSPFNSGTASDKNWIGGFIQYPYSSIDAVMRAIAHFTQNVSDPKATLFGTFVFEIVSGVVTPIIQIYIFYNGNSLPQTVFGELLSIPASNTSINPMSYAEIVQTTFPASATDSHGSTYQYASSVLQGSNEQAFIDAITSNLNFTQTFKQDLASTSLTFTPIPQSQVLAGRANGGNVIDPPRGNYAVVTIMETLPLGVVNIPARLVAGRQTLLKQIKSTPGIPLFLSESGADQNVFASYGQYDFMKRTYAKYDPTRFNVRFTAGPTGL